MTTIAPHAVPLRESFTPKELAGAVGASESSVKRWIDQGLLPASKTPGGHRRVALADAVRFIREAGRTLVDPAALGLPAGDAAGFADPVAICATYLAALETGDEATTTGLVCRLHLLDHPPSAICDNPVFAAYRELRGRCHHPSAECVVLHRALANSVRALHRLRELLPPPPANAPTALLADVGYEIDGLPVHMAEAVLTGLGFRCVQLGVNVPDEVLFGAIDRVRPTVLWLSADGGDKADAPTVRRTTAELLRITADRPVRVLLSGAALPTPGNQECRRDSAATVLGSMTELNRFIRENV